MSGRLVLEFWAVWVLISKFLDFKGDCMPRPIRGFMSLALFPSFIS